MIYLFENPDNNTSIVYDGSILTEKLRSESIILEQLPEKQELKNKIAILKCKKSTNEVWWEYQDTQISMPESTELEKRIAALEKSNAELMGLISTMSAPTV